ncbi:MAG: phosphatidate cytidylyltransferase [Lachnospiraceae bacterium]|jgi:phosphatidate cytidylyltransferase|nr:phosphatidate cytidylyltransferase [Lachnospiraceae bacterium]
MKDRLIGGFFVGIVTLVALLTGGIVTTCILAVVSLIGIWEYLRIYSLEKSVFAFVDYAFTIAFYALIFLNKEFLFFPAIIGLLMVILAIYVFNFPKYMDHDVAKVLFIFVYVTVLLSYVLRLREMESGLYLVFYLLIASWGNDICAYFFGRALGKHKLAPKVSPNKSIEGFIGGIFGAFAIGIAFAMVFPEQLPFTVPVFGGVVAAVAAMASVIGDLAASAIKRNHDIKDYSSLIPGHGGILDRFDSVIYIAPIIYWLVRLIEMVF